MMTSGTTGRPKTIAGSHTASEKNAMVTNGFGAKMNKSHLEWSKILVGLATVYIGLYDPSSNLRIMIIVL